MFQLLLDAPQIDTGTRRFQVSEYDQDYRGFHVAIGLQSGNDASTGAFFGYHVQKLVDGVLREWYCRVESVPALSGEIATCPSRLDVIRLTPEPGPGAARDLHRRLINAYKVAIQAQDLMNA